MVEIVPYRDSWPSEFRQIASQLRAALGELAPRIDHIGSTSVLGLSAKDVIDIQVTVVALNDRLIAAMRPLDYTPAEGNWNDHQPPNANGSEADWEKLYFDAPPGQRHAHIRVRVQGRANQRYPLLFRDYLRLHPDTPTAYAELKRRLAQHLADPDMYPAVKDAAVDLIYLAAEDWALAVAWQPCKHDQRT